LQNPAKVGDVCKTVSKPQPQTPRGLAVRFAQKFLCKIFMIQIVQAGAV
jgi:hypothetical protein